jgi:hypothetical protein
MPQKRRVFHQAFFLELVVRCECRVCSRRMVSVRGVALRLDDGSTRDLHELLEVALRTLRSWDSVGPVRVSAGCEVIASMSSWPLLAIHND